MLFLVQTYAFTPDKGGRRLASHEKVNFKSDRLFHDVSLSSDGDILVGHVRITHDGMLLTCDSAVVYEATNSFLAYGHVHMTQGDTLSLKGDSLYYDGSQEFAQVFDNVSMRHGSMTLYTDILNYDRMVGRGFYDTGGKIVDGKTVLTSQNGEYFTEDKTATFNYDVLLLNNAKDSIITDTLHYDTKDKWAHTLGPSNILSDGSRIYTEDGYYNTDTGKARFYQRPQFFKDGRKLEGDSIHYDKEAQISHAFGNIFFHDPKNKSILIGNYGWYNDSTGEALCTDSALAKDFSNVDDTLFIHGDTLRLLSFYHKTDSAYRVLKGYNHIRGYRSDLQLVSDSLCFISKDSCLSLYKDPILWSESRQILGEIIHVYINDSTMDSVYVDQQALMVEQLTDSVLYNQVSGNLMRAYFAEDGKLSQCAVDGNGIVINYPMEKDSTYIYLNYIEAAKLRAFLEDGKMRTMRAYPSPKGTTYPIDLAPDDKRKMSNFVWFDWIRPTDPTDLYVWRGKNESQKLKETPRRKAPLQTLKKLHKTGVVPEDPASSQEPAPTDDSVTVDSTPVDTTTADSTETISTETISPSPTDHE